jgi:RNA polymerase sigma factor (sigma-70 family)
MQPGANRARSAAGSCGAPKAEANEDQLDRATDPKPGPAERTEHADEQRRVMQLLQSLPQDYRLPLLLRYIGGADYETIGRQLAISNGSLRGLLQRGMKMLREKMTETNPVQDQHAGTRIVSNSHESSRMEGTK